MAFALHSTPTRVLTTVMALLGVTLTTPRAHAQEATCSARHSSCLQSNQQWLPLRPGRFATLDVGRAQPRGSLAATLATTYQHEPLTLRAASPDPAGRQLALVEHVVDTTLITSFAVSERLDLGTALNMVLKQSGAGIEVVRSRNPDRLETTAVRDPRLGVGYLLLDDDDTKHHYRARVRTDLTLPLGDARSFTRDRSPVLAPGTSFVLGSSHFELGADASLRLRQPVTLAEVRHGSQLVTQLGVAVELVNHRQLRASAETSWFWSLVSSTQNAKRAGLRQLPAEWLLGLTSQLGPSSALGLYGGGGLPVSARKVETGVGGGSESFVGLGAPDVRLLLLFVQQG